MTNFSEAMEKQILRADKLNVILQGMNVNYPDGDATQDALFLNLESTLNQLTMDLVAIANYTNTKGETKQDIAEILATITH